MGSRLAYVGSTLSILKLFAGNVWVFQSTLVAEQPERDKRSEQFYTSVSELCFLLRPQQLYDISASPIYWPH